MQHLWRNVKIFMLHPSNCSNKGNFHQKRVPRYSWVELSLGALSNPHNANGAWGMVLLQSNRRWLQGDGSMLSTSCRIINLIDPSSLSILRFSELHSSIVFTFLLGKADQAKEEKGALNSSKAKRNRDSLQNVFSGVRKRKAVCSQRHQRQGTPSPSCAGGVWLRLALQPGVTQRDRERCFSCVIRNG